MAAPAVMSCLRLHEGASDAILTTSPTPTSDNDCLIKVIRAGICSTDLEIIRGYKAGFCNILGHEFVGLVIQGPESLKGKRVVGEINLPCGSCPTCDRGADRKRNHCPNRRCLGIVAKDGTFAEFITLPAANLLEVPAEIPDAIAVFTEPLAAACRILEQRLVSAGQRVAILGDGKLGLLIALVLSRFLCTGDGSGSGSGEVVLFGRHRRNLSLAPPCVTTVHTPRPGSHATPPGASGGDEPAKAQDGSGSSSGGVSGGDDPYAPYADAFHCVVEATGSMGGLVACSRLVAPMGTIVLKSTCAVETGASSLQQAALGGGGAVFDTTPLVVKEVRVMGSRCGPFAAALHLLATGQLPEAITAPLCLTPPPPPPAAAAADGSGTTAPAPGTPAAQQQQEKQEVKQQEEGSSGDSAPPPPQQLLPYSSLHAQLTAMVHAEFPLSQGVAALEAARAPGALKVQLVM